MARAYIGLGSNLGDRERTLRNALEMLGDEPGVEVVGVSAFRETEPVGVVEQPRFVNAAAALETEVGARKLLDVLLDLERRLGRVRDGRRWGPRVVDLDLLLYGDEMWDEPGIRVPHPHLHERRFALEPLADIDPGLAIPGRGSVSALLAHLD